MKRTCLMLTTVALQFAALAVTPVVVLPEAPTAVERSAASELAGELGKVLGEKVEIVGEGQASSSAALAKEGSSRPRLYVGATKAAKAVRGDKAWQTDEVLLKSVAGGVVLAGDPARAPLYAVDLYLEKFCGVRWWTSTAAHYPHLAAAPVADINLAYAPQFKYRETYYLDGFDPLFKVRSKGNFTSRTRYLLSPLEFVPKSLGGDHSLYFFKGRGSAYHSFFEVLPPKQYFKDHPDWYSLVNGKRVAKQLCLANEEMKKEYIRETLKRLAEDPAVDFIQVSQNDWNGYCQCEKCKAMMAEDGGAASGPYIRFANDVAAAVEKQFPKVRVDTFAYQFTRKAPTKTRPRHNVVVRLCDIECDFARPLDGRADLCVGRQGGGRDGARPSQDPNAKFVRDLSAWRQVAKGNLFIWDYLADFASYMMPHPNLYSIAPNIRLFAENGAVGVFEQGDALCSAGSFAGLRHYLASHLLWNPEDDERKLIDEFLVGYYGKSAAPHLKQFLDLLDRGAKTKQMFIGCYHPGAPFWTVDEKLDAADFMDAAEAAAAKDGAEYAARVRRERLSVDHYLLLNYDILRDSAEKAKRAWKRSASRAQAVENWIRDVKSEGVRAVHETNDAKTQERYFEKLRGPEAKLVQELKRNTAPVGDARVGFAMGFQNNTRVAAEEMRSLSVVTNAGKVVATWKGHPNCGDDFTVKASFPLTAEGGFEWGDFTYSGNTNAQHVTRIVFPEVYVPRGEKTALFVPRMAGAVLRPSWSRCRPRQDMFTQGPHFCVFRCMAALEEGAPSHFFDQRGEARLYSSTMQIQNGPVPDTLVMRNSYLPPLTDELSRAGALPFGGSFTPYMGGWWEAAMLHREWMKQQDWFQAAAKRDFSKFREIDLWMWGRGGIEVSEAPVLWFMKETGLKVALDWYWWHNVPYDTCYPFFWPPRDGEEAFRASVARMQKAGAFVQVYTNGMLWDCDDKRFAEGGMESTLMRANGKVYSCVYNPFTKQAQALMCGEAPIFQAKMRKLEKTLASTGLDGVYMDMISCAANGPCYNPRHHHAPGGGRAVVDGYRAYVQKVREDNPGFLLSSEATSEEYLDRFEAFIMLYSSWERNHFGLLPEVEPVPAVSVIFRGAAVLFGSFATPGGVPGWDPLWGKNLDAADVEKLVAPYPDQFAVEFARGAVWGVQPMVHNFVMRDVTNPRVKDDIEFMKTTAKFWHDHRDFLFDGEMLAPVKLECATQRTDFLDTSSYQRPHQSRKVTQPALPTVFHSGWRAKDGREAEILVNWSRKPQQYRFERGGRVFDGTLPPLGWACLPISAPAPARVEVLPQCFDAGGWSLDVQFMDVMGSPYLIAHGRGIRVLDAKARVSIPEAGEWRVWARSRKWVEGAGAWQLSVNGERLAKTFGTSQSEWAWEDGGTVRLEQGEATIRLIDGDGFDGRCAGVVLTKGGAVPQGALTHEGMPVARRLNADFVVVGGGMPGCCAAVAAARRGLKTVLVQDRPVLGGNASAEVRVWSGGEARYPLVRELRGWFMNRDANHALSDAHRMRTVADEPNLEVLLCTRAFAATKAGDAIRSVKALDWKRNEVVEISAPLFCDATGDGWLGFWAGADWRMGREAKSEHGEPSAPAQSDGDTLGASLMWTSSLANTDVPFSAPWAEPWARGECVVNGEWNWEYGIHQDMVKDGEWIRDRLLLAIYGAFSRAKCLPENSRRVLDFLPFILGKRESRRLLGDWILSENDFRNRVRFDDAIASTSWAIDLHYDNAKPGVDFLTTCTGDMYGRCWIPYRCIYSRNVSNLFMAGRCFSTTHVGSGSPRVINTLSQLGVAAGEAAALCRKYGCRPRAIWKEGKVRELQLLLGGSFPGCVDVVRSTWREIDDESKSVTFNGKWQKRRWCNGEQYGDFAHVPGAGAVSAVYRLPVAKKGRYTIMGKVPYEWQANPRSSTMMVVESGGRRTEVAFNQLLCCGEWRKVGSFELEPGATLTIDAKRSHGFVVADAFALVAE